MPPGVISFLLPYPGAMTDDSPFYKVTTALGVHLVQPAVLSLTLVWLAPPGRWAPPHTLSSGHALGHPGVATTRMCLTCGHLGSRHRAAQRRAQTGGVACVSPLPHTSPWLTQTHAADRAIGSPRSPQPGGPRAGLRRAAATAPAPPPSPGEGTGPPLPCPAPVSGT